MKKEEVVTIEPNFKERVLQFYFFHKRKIHSYIAFSLGLSMLLITYLSSKPGAEEISQAKKTFENWKKTPLDTTLREGMSKSLKKIAGLERAKESEIAQTLISAAQSDSADLFAKAPIERLKKESPYHAIYAEGTLQIEKKEFQKALESSVALKAQMERDRDISVLKAKNLRGGCTVYACNLLRIALLQKKVGNVPGELAAWEELKGLLALQEDSVAAQLLEANFKIKGDFSLSDFISQREKILTH